MSRSPYAQPRARPGRAEQGAAYQARRRAEALALSPRLPISPALPP
eukprot:CAMPEP_0182874522 /NCGR_PEP_ID=MMETSP0034_2-20130328/12989_1 /TAXON_ID=156128 /ORGANISM="Nephroselmis pyriformis, Strain CCMP717" /LENGTH=45 /DNA_ID= /DNA_START= /DNA_END= /DNA_ORIENTATION=